MNIKDVINEFDKTQKEQEEALKNVAENTEPVEQTGEAKAEGEFVEAPKAEDAPDNVTDQEAQVEADAKESEAKADVNEDEAENAKDEEAKDEDEQAEKSVEDKDAEDADKEDKEEDKAEKSVEDEEQTEKAKSKSDSKEEDKDEDEEDEDEDAPKKDKKKKPEQVKKSEDELTDMEGLIGVVLKSYQQSVQGQNAMMATIAELKAQVETLNAKLEQVKVEEEATSKSILQDETDEDEVEDKAVGYASKNMAPEAEVAVEEDHNNDGEVQDEAQPETFVYSQHSQKFMEKFQQDLRTDGLPRRDVDSYRQAFLDASEGNASEYALASLYEYINK